MLKDTWEAGKSANENVVSYVVNMREKFVAMTDLVQKNVSQAKHRQKTWYDHHARERELVAGKKVLVLLPTESNKMKAQWQGPYHVVRKVGLVDYEVDMVDRWKRKRIFHNNMLQKWHALTNTDLWVEAEGDGECEEEGILTWGGTDQVELSMMGKDLGQLERGQLRRLLDEFKDVMRSDPG